MYHYSKNELVNAIRNVGIKPGDVVSLQVSLGRLGMPNGAHDFESVSNMVIDSFFEVLGAEGTLIVPTYTYSIGRGEVFEVEETPSAIGEFTEIFRKRNGVIRSRDPMLSSAGYGPMAKTILRDISKSCYGIGSTFQNLHGADAKICTLGISIYWATYRHYIEEIVGVPFRFIKRFEGVIRESGISRVEEWDYFAAPFLDNCQPDGLVLEDILRKYSLINIEQIGRGEIMCIGAKEYFEYGTNELIKDPWLTAKGPRCSEEYMRENLNK